MRHTLLCCLLLLPLGVAGCASHSQPPSDMAYYDVDLPELPKLKRYRQQAGQPQGPAEPQLASGPSIREVLLEEHDRVQVSIRRRILKPEVIDFIAKADQQYQLTQRERITLGLLAQHEAMTARELASALELPSGGELALWLKRPLDWKIVQTRGRTQSTRYYIDPQLLKGLEFIGDTTLKRIEPHRLLALIEEDVGHYRGTKIGQIHERIGPEIPRSRLKRAMKQLVEERRLVTEGKGSGTRYSLP